MSVSLWDIKNILEWDCYLTKGMKESLHYRVLEVTDEWIDSDEMEPNNELSPEQWAMIWDPYVEWSTHYDIDDDIYHPTEPFTTPRDDIEKDGTLEEILKIVRNHIERPIKSAEELTILAKNAHDCSLRVGNIQYSEEYPGIVTSDGKNPIRLDLPIPDDTPEWEQFVTAVIAMERYYLIHVVFEPTYVLP